MPVSLSHECVLSTGICVPQIWISLCSLVLDYKCGIMQAIEHLNKLAEIKNADLDFREKNIPGQFFEKLIQSVTWETLC